MWFQGMGNDTNNIPTFVLVNHPTWEVSWFVMGIMMFASGLDPLVRWLTGKMRINHGG